MMKFYSKKYLKAVEVDWFHEKSRITPIYIKKI
jgi:hypothetical protein